MAIAYYTQKGFGVSVPITDNLRYDLIVDSGRSLQRLQVKTTRYQEPSGIFSVSLKTSGGNQSWNGIIKRISSEECDLLFVYVLDGRCYEFPPAIFDGKSSLNLGPDKDLYKVWEVPVLAQI